MEKPMPWAPPVMMALETLNSDMVGPLTIRRLVMDGRMLVLLIVTVLRTGAE